VLPSSPDADYKAFKEWKKSAPAQAEQGPRIQIYRKKGDSVCQDGENFDFLLSLYLRFIHRSEPSERPTSGVTSNGPTRSARRAIITTGGERGHCVVHQGDEAFQTMASGGERDDDVAPSHQGDGACQALASGGGGEISATPQNDAEWIERGLAWLGSETIKVQSQVYIYVKALQDRWTDSLEQSNAGRSLQLMERRYILNLTRGMVRDGSSI
jgi:hypothetical protein